MDNLVIAVISGFFVASVTLAIFYFACRDK